MSPARERFTPLPAGSIVIRLAEPGGGFLPPDERLPLAQWLEPTSEDVADGERRGRAAGVSVWDLAETTFEQARAITRRPTSLGFSLSVDRCRRVAADAGRTVEVVADPLEGEDAQLPGAEGHSLVEGLKRPPGVVRADHRALLQKPVACCRPMP